MAQARGDGTPQTVQLPQGLLERIDRYAARLEGELHLSVSRSAACSPWLWKMPRTPPRPEAPAGTCALLLFQLRGALVRATGPQPAPSPFGAPLWG